MDHSHISFYPHAIRTNHLARLLRCKDACKEACSFLRLYGSLCHSSKGTFLAHQHLLWLNGCFWKKPEHTKYASPLLLPLWKICGRRLSWHCSHLPQRVAVFSTLFRTGPALALLVCSARSGTRSPQLSSTKSHDGTSQAMPSSGHSRCVCSVLR